MVEVGNSERVHLTKVALALTLATGVAVTSIGTRSYTSSDIGRVAGADAVVGAGAAVGAGAGTVLGAGVWTPATAAPGAAHDSRAAYASAAVDTARWTWPLLPAEVVHRFVAPMSRWAPGHRGVDLAGGIGGPVLAPTDGRVSFAGSVAGRGVVVVEHSGGLRSTLEPTRALVPLGQLVARGEPIAALTAEPTHCAPATCLHWGVLRGEDYLDPQALIAGRVVLLPTSPG